MITNTSVVLPHRTKLDGEEKAHADRDIPEDVLTGISLSCLGSSQSSRVRLPVTAILLRRIKGELERSAHPERQVVWAVCCRAFFGFFRLGKLLRSSSSDFNPRLHLSWGDIKSLEPRMLRFRLLQSKTDQFGRGVDIVLGKTGCDFARWPQFSATCRLRETSRAHSSLNPQIARS